MEKIALLGSTGSIGRQTLEVLRLFPHKYQARLLAASGSKPGLLLDQIKEFMPAFVYVADPRAGQELKDSCQGLASCPQIFSEDARLEDLLASHELDSCLAAISGFAGLAPLWAAIEGQKKIYLANKEALVTAGDLIMDRVHKQGLILRPVDSEHSAIFQCLEGSQRQVGKVILTASGGPFRKLAREKFSTITPRDALNHPTWQMGRKITIDSASLANKGLEVMEAAHLFNLSYDQIEVLVHPESIIHSLVEFVDGAQLAQLGLADMRLAIQYALTSPFSLPSPFKRLDLAQIGSLTFQAPRRQDFPLLDLAYQAGRQGRSAGLAYNTANEVAVDLFLKEKLSFVDMAYLVEKALAAYADIDLESIDHILALDEEIRHFLYADYERKTL